MENLNQFKDQKYMSVETFRKSGVGVKTPVWFVEFNNQFCFTTETDSGKAKRMRKNPKVQIAPCKMDGTVIGTWVPGNARFLEGAEVKSVDKVYSNKYRSTKFLFNLVGILRKNPKRDYYAIALD